MRLFSYKTFVHLLCGSRSAAWFFSKNLPLVEPLFMLLLLLLLIISARPETHKGFYFRHQIAGGCKMKGEGGSGGGGEGG